MPSRPSPITVTLAPSVATATLRFDTPGAGFSEITAHAKAFIASCKAQDGALLVFLRHTSASLTIQENADPDVQADLERFLARLVPDGDPLFEHTSEGRDDMPAHVRTALTQTHLAVPLHHGALMLGTWQGIFVYEHRRQGHLREVVLHLNGA